MATSSKTTTSTTNTSCSNPIIIGTTTPSSSSSSTVSLSSLVSTSYASLKKNDDLDDIDYYYLTDTIKTATNSNASSAPKDNKYSKLSGTSRYLTQPTDPLRMKSENEGKIEDDNDVASEASRLPQSMSYTSNLKSMTNIDSGSKFGSAKHFESSNRDVPSYGSTTFNSVTRRSVSKPPPTALESAKNQQSSLLAAARSAPPSELASPVISRVPRKSSAKDHEKDAKQAPLDADVSKTATNVPNVSSGSSAKEDMFSIFSGLKDRLARVSAESREILDRRVFKSGSMDGQKLVASVLVDSASEGEKLNECNECEVGPGGVDGQLVVKDADDGCPENGERDDGEGKVKTSKMSKKNSREGENNEGSSRNDDDGDDNDDDVGTDGKSKEATTTSTATTSSSANKSSLSTTTSMKMKQAKETEMKVFKSSAASLTQSLGNDDQRLKSHTQKIRESSSNNNSFDISRLMKLVQDSDYPSKKCTFSRKWSGDDSSHNIEDDDDEVGAASSASDLITPEAAVEAFNLTHLHNSTTAPDLKSKRFTSQLFKKSDTQKKNISKSLAESDSAGGISKYDSLVNSDVTFSGQRMMNPFAGDRKESSSSSSSKPSSSISLTFSSLLSRQKSLPKLTYGGSAGSAVDPAANQQMVDLQDESLKANLNKRSDSKNNLHNLDSDLEYFNLHDNKLDGADEDDPNRPLDVRDANDCNSYLDEDLANTSNNNKTTPADESERSSPAAKSSKKVRQVTFTSSVLKFQKFRSNLLTKILFYVLLVMTLLIVPLSPYIFGFLVGVLGTIVFGWIFTVLDAVNSLFFHEEDRYREALNICEDREIYYRFGDQWTPDIKLSKNSDDCFKGWLNELPTSASAVASTAASSAILAAAPPPQQIQQQFASSRRNSVISIDDTDVILPVAYSPETYHISSTVSVFATLEGSNLRLQTPKQGIPKRALWSDDAYANVTFVRQRHFNLLNSKVILLPINIVSKRMWSKKYPIAIELASQQQQQSQGSAAASNVTANSVAAATNSAATSSFVAAGKKTNFTAASQLIRRNRKPDKKSTTAATTLTATTATATTATANTSIANTNADTEMIVMASSSQKPAIGQSAALSQSVVLPSNQSKENMKKVIYLFARTSRDK
ncbi:hypothetical protein HELRODRAFT_194380, partial [Helobdella robusta]|uniref:Uncharacterized protein n=1 Tax=Helobdella robusta TaxID=6412 RepID=T1FW00_HELRO